jgi:hypothetical protein
MGIKTLEDAIGCWTVNPAYNSLPELAKAVGEAARWCRQSTLAKRNDPAPLMRDLRILRARIDSMAELTDDAIRRCGQIIDTAELGSEH